MFQTIKVIVHGDEGDARVDEQKLKLKGYKVTIESTRQSVLDGSSLGGHLDILTDPDETVYVVIGTK
jgi:hypothetical protein